jgi:hypothetical protein
MWDCSRLLPSSQWYCWAGFLKAPDAALPNVLARAIIRIELVQPNMKPMEEMTREELEERMDEAARGYAYTPKFKAVSA